MQTKETILKVINHYQAYANRFINIDKEDLDNLYKSINDR